MRLFLQEISMILIAIGFVVLVNVFIVARGEKVNAIILAAGLGSRFKEITQKTHKALLPLLMVSQILNKPLFI